VGHLSSRTRGGRNVALAAAAAWSQRHPGLPKPTASHLLKTHPNSTVCKLDGARPDGSAVVAKLAPQAAIASERWFYSHILPDLPVETPECLGVTTSEHGFWLFLSYVDGLPYDSSRTEHRRLAGRYAGLLHATSSRHGLDKGLARRGTAFVKEQLDGALAAVHCGRTNEAVAKGDQAMLREFQSRLDLLEARWSQFGEFLDSMPHAIVHGDFVSKNLRVLETGGEEELVVMDWEMAGWGPVAMDLGWVDVEAYRSTIASTWPGLDAGTLTDLSNCGRLLRVVTAVQWEAAGLRASHVERSTQRLRAYLEQLDSVLAAAHWIE